MARLNNYPDITIDSERGLINIRDYILNMDRLGKFGGELEIGIAANIYDINIATYGFVVYIIII